MKRNRSRILFRVWSSAFRRFGAPVGLGSLFLVFCSAPAEEGEKVGLLFEGTFALSGEAITSEVEGAKKTRLAAAYVWRYGVDLFNDQSWKKRGMQWESFAVKAAKLADKLAGEIRPRYFRDLRGVIEYAIVSGDDPFLSSAITSPVFVDAFEETLGTKLRVIIPDRNVLYVFPATGPGMEEMSNDLARVYSQTPLPVSLEIFEVTKKSFRVIGEIEIERKQRPLE